MKRDELASARDAKNLTQEDVARRAGITRSYYGLIENGVRNPTLNIALKIAEALDLKIEDAFPNVIFFAGKSYEVKPDDNEDAATLDSA